MKIRLLITLAGLVIGFGLPTIAQQMNAPDPQLREQMLAFVTKFDPPLPVNRSFWHHQNRVVLVKFWTDLFQKVHFSNHLGTLDQYSPHLIGTSGNEAWATGGWSQNIEGLKLGVKGYWSGVVVRDGDAWKFRLHAITPPPPYAPETK